MIVLILLINNAVDLTNEAMYFRAEEIDVQVITKVMIHRLFPCGNGLQINMSQTQRP